MAIIFTTAPRPERVDVDASRRRIQELLPQRTEFARPDRAPDTSRNRKRGARKHSSRATRTIL